MADTAPDHRPAADSFNPGIHGARGLFCLFVLVYHVWNSGLPRWPVPELLDQAMNSLRYGVELFFAISGFVIFVTMRPVLAGHRSPLDFLFNRASRIFPVLWVTIAVFVPLALLAGQDGLTDHLTPLWLFGAKLAGNLLALGPVWPVPVFYGVAWTIGYEVAFYGLCFAYLAARAWLGRNLGLPVMAIGLLLIAFHPRAVFFIAGILVAQGVFSIGPLRRLAVWPLAWLVLFLTAWQGLAAAQTPYFTTMFDWTLTGQWPLALVAFAALTLAMAGIARGEGWFCRLLRSRPLQWAGTVSYSLYLWHLIVLGVVKTAMTMAGLTALAGGGAQILLLLIGLPASLLLAQISYRLLEQRLTGWLRRRWRSPRSQPLPDSARRA